MADEDEEEYAEEASYRHRRPRVLLFSIAALLFVFIALTTVSAVLTDRWWFGSVRYPDVWSRLFLVKSGLFLVGGALMALAVGINIVVAYRARPTGLRPTIDQIGLERYREAVDPVRRLITVGTSLVVGAFAGSTAVGQWRRYLLWEYSEPFGIGDPYFHKDAGFYVFQLPWLHFVVDFVLAMALLGLLAATAVHYLYGGIRLTDSRQRLSSAARRHLSVLAVILVGAKACDYWLQRYDALVRPGKLLTGVTWTDTHAVMPADAIMCGICVIVAAVFALNAWRRLAVVPGAALGLLVVCSVLLGMIWPGLVQEGTVRGAELAHERTYLQRNIDATLRGYGLDRMTTQTFAATTSPPSPAELQSVLVAVAHQPVLDPSLMNRVLDHETPNQPFFTVAGSVSLDHFLVDGVDRPVVVGVRGVSQDGIPERSWENVRLRYTHGAGVLGLFADQEAAGGGSAGLDYQWALGHESDQLGLGAFSDRIYFGPSEPSYSVVGQPAGAEPVEVDLSGNSTYVGAGGVPLDNLWRQLLFAVKFSDGNLLTSSSLNDNSRILYDRNPREMLEKVAPWLTWDSDPYPVVVDGRTEWVLDGYTTTDHYPSSQRGSIDALFGTDDQSGRIFRNDDQLNYVRDAVKATVDASDGTIRLYAWDEGDPLLKAWRAAFPGVVADRADIPTALLPHLRYPADLLKAQRTQLARYHVTDPSAFLSDRDPWQVAIDPDNAAVVQAPERVYVDGRWSLVTSFTGLGKDNLAGYLTADSAGRLTLLSVTPDQLPGPREAAAMMTADPQVKTLLAEAQIGDTRPVLGNLVTIPVGSRFLSYRPVFTLRTTDTEAAPQLEAVVVEYAGRIGTGPSLADALTAAIAPPASDAAVRAQISDLLQRAMELDRKADASHAAGRLRQEVRQRARATRLVARAASLASS